MWDIPADMLQVTLNTHLPITTKIVNLSFENWCFPDNLKLSEVRPIFHKINQRKKKQNKTKTKQKQKTNQNDDIDIENCRSISIFLNVWKVFKRIICTQVDAFMQDKLSNLLTGFRKKHSTQHCLMHMPEIWKNILDKGYVNCFIKGFWHNTPWFNDSQVRSVWRSTRCSSVHEKLCN